MSFHKNKFILSKNQPNYNNQNFSHTNKLNNIRMKRADLIKICFYNPKKLQKLKKFFRLIELLSSKMSCY